MFCEYDNLYYLCVLVRWRNGRAQAVDEKLSNGKNGYLIYRFESCPDYKDIYLRIELAIRNSTERVTPSERSP